MLIGTIILTAFGMPYAVFGIFGLGGDVTDAAVVAGIFSVINTYLNVRMLRQVGAVKRTARASTESLMELADVRSGDKPSAGKRRRKSDK